MTEVPAPRIRAALLVGRRPHVVLGPPPDRLGYRRREHGAIAADLYLERASAGRGRLGVNVARYVVHFIDGGRPERLAVLQGALRGEIQALGVHRSVELVFGHAEGGKVPVVTVFLGAPGAPDDPALEYACARALAQAHVVLPVVDDLASFHDQVPPSLRAINGLRWNEDQPVVNARVVLAELGIEERQRSVFISHKREDGLLAAEQLHDALRRHRFEPFIDRFHVEPGERVQDAIADALEARAFLLLLETPKAHLSEFVFDEVEYALTHAMGVHIVKWPGDVAEVPGSARLPRQILEGTELTRVGEFDEFTVAAIDSVVAEVEAAHAVALARRRRALLRNVEDAAEVAGRTCVPLPGWRLLVYGDGQRDVVGVTGRLPSVADLHRLDLARADLDDPSAVLVHASRRLRPDRRDLLDWAKGERPIQLVPENAVGRYWA